MNNDYSELVTYLDKKFQGIDQRFVEVNQNFSNLQSAVDAYAKKADTYFQEMVALSHKVNRMEKWIQQLADKAGIKLEY